jgi:hypothetical protein
MAEKIRDPCLELSAYHFYAIKLPIKKARERVFAYH